MNIRMIAIALLLIALPVSAQKKKKTVMNDSNTPCIYCNLLIRVRMVI